MTKQLLLVLSVIASVTAQDLRNTVNEILSTNPIVLERLKNYYITKENIKYAESEFYPKLDLYIGTGFEKTGKRDANGIDTMIGFEDSFIVYESSLTYTHNLFKGFETTYALQESKNRTIAAAYNYLENANDVSFKTVNTYIQVMKNKELLEISKENVKNTEEIFNKVQKLYDAGLTTLSEVNKVESSLSLARSNLVVQENTFLDVTYNMQRHLGRHINIQTMSKPELNIELPLNIEDAALLAMQNNPSLLVSKYNIKIAQATYKKTKALFYPQIDVTISQSMNKNLSALEGEDDRFRAIASLSYNFFNGFTDKVQLQQAISTIHQEIEIKNTLRREVIEGLSLSWTANKKLTEQLKHLKDYQEFSLKTLTLYTKEYDLGRRSLLDLLSAQNDFIASRTQIINTSYSILFAKYRIHDAMGTLIADITGNTDIIYSNVELIGKAPKNEDSLPIQFDRDKDLIVDEYDICNNSLTTEVRNIFGCKHVDEDTKRIERYSGFLFEDDSELSSEGQKRLDNLIKQIQPYGWEYLKFDILGNAENADMDERKLLKISKKRAELIKTKLIEAGAIKANISIHAKADSAPMFSNESGNSVRLNNRADIIVTKLRYTEQ